MKQKLLFLLLALFAFVFIGCKKLTEFNALGGWRDGGDEVYEITTNTEEKLAFTYDKGDKADAYLESAEIKEKLSGMKKLVITLKGMGAVKIELVGTKTTKSVSINVIANEGSYEWNLMPEAYFLKGLKRIRIYGAPGKTDATGNVEISELKFYNTEATNYIIQTDFNNIPDNVNEYDGTSATFNFNSKWERYVPEEEVYNIQVVGNVTRVTVEKSAGAEWACIQARVKGNFEKFNYVVARVKGTAGQPFILKAANNYETKVWLTGEEQYVAVDISGMSASEKNAIQAIFVFGYAGEPSGSGYFEIIEAFMTEEWDTGIIKNVYDGQADTFSIAHWYDHGDNVYTVTEEDGVAVIEYDKKNFSWAFAEAFIEGDISRFGKIVIEITGTAGKQVMFKIEAEGSNVEKYIDFDGTKQTVEMIIATMPQSALKKVNKVMVFAAPGAANATGSFTIHSVTFVEYDAPVEPDEPVEAKEDADITRGWIDGGDGVYTFQENQDGSVTVNYSKGDHEWAHVRQEFKDDLAGYNTITLVLRGTAGKSVILKPNDDGKLEQTVTFEEGKDVVFTATAEKITKMIIMAEGGTKDATGSFTIVSATLSLVADATADFEDGGDEVYTFEENEDGSVTVTYNKGTGKEWANLKALFEGNYEGFNTITLVLRGPSGKTILLKPNDDGALEKSFTFEEGKDVTYTVSAKAITKCLIFMEPGAAGQGSFTIVSVTLSHVKPEVIEARESADITQGWIDGGDGVYTFEENQDGSVTVNYNKGNFEWAHFRQEFKDDLAGYNTITLILRGAAGKSVILKPNDDNKLEKTVTFEEGKDVIFTATAKEITKMVIIAEGGTKDATGSFTIVSATLSYSVDAADAFEDGSDGVYAFVKNQDGTVTVNYNKPAGKEWAFLRADFADKYSSFNTITLVLRGPAGKAILLKPNDVNELEQTLTFEEGKDLTFTITLKELQKFLMFMDPGVAGQGSFTIVSVTLSHVKPEVIEAKESADITQGWIDGGDGVYTFEENQDGSVTVNYDKGDNEWAHFRQEFKDNLAGYNTITLILRGTAGKSILLKPNDRNEKLITFEEGKDVIFTATDYVLTKMVIIAEGGTKDATGSFTIVSATLSFVVDATADFEDGGDGVYSFEKNQDGTVTVSYNKGAGKEWANLRASFEDKYSGFNTITLVLRGPAGKNVLLKPNNAGTLEKSFTFEEGKDVTYTVSAEEITNCLIFMEPDAAGQGSFTIVSVLLSYEKTE